MLVIAVGRLNERPSEEVGMSRSTLSLSVTARTALEPLCHTATQPCLRERAAAILTLAAGESARRVARAGLLQPRKVETVCRGLARYRAEGVAGLTIRPGPRAQARVFPLSSPMRRPHAPRGSTSWAACRASVAWGSRAVGWGTARRKAHRTPLQAPAGFRPRHAPSP